MKNETVSISNLGDGALAELFDRELARVLENISDVNTESTAKREITLKVNFQPDVDRETSQVSIVATAKLAGSVGVSTRVYIGTRGGEKVAVEFDPKQLNLNIGEVKGIEHG